MLRFPVQPNTLFINDMERSHIYHWSMPQILFKIQFVHSQLLKSWTHFHLKSGQTYFKSLLWRLNYMVRVLSQPGETVGAECLLQQQHDSPGWPWTELILKFSKLTLAKDYFSVILKMVGPYHPGVLTWWWWLGLWLLSSSQYIFSVSVKEFMWFSVGLF